MAQGTDAKRPKNSKAYKKPRSKASDEQTESRQPKQKTRPQIPIQLQQAILNVFRNSFPDHNSNELQRPIQELKGYLFNRDFEKAFGRKDLLTAYAIRWSPSRALAYLEIFCDLKLISRCIEQGSSSANAEEETQNLRDKSVAPAVRSGVLGSSQQHRSSHPPPESMDINNLNVVCIGAGSGSEILAIAGYSNYLSSEGDLVKEGVKNDDGAVENIPKFSFDIRILDVADWSYVVTRLCAGATNVPPLSKYSSLSATSKSPLIESSSFKVSFTQQDVLKAEVEPLTSVFQDVKLVTILFTLNELYSVSKNKTTSFLLALTYLMDPGSLLLVVDSPGSYSSVNIDKGSKQPNGTSEKKYPMSWLLDHTLLESSNIGSGVNRAEGVQWEKLVSIDSKWFRLPSDLKYSLDLEDMRYQLHLYRHH